MENLNCKYCSTKLSNNFSKKRHETTCKTKKSWLINNSENLKNKLDYCEKLLSFNRIKVDYDNPVDFEKDFCIFKKKYIRTWINSITKITNVKSLYKTLIFFQDKQLYWIGDINRKFCYFYDKSGNKVKDEKCKRLIYHTAYRLERKLRELKDNSRIKKSEFSENDSSSSSEDENDGYNSCSEKDQVDIIMDTINSSAFIKIISSIKR